MAKRVHKISKNNSTKKRVVKKDVSFGKEKKSRLIPLSLIGLGILFILIFIYWRVSQLYLSFLTVPVSQHVDNSNNPAANRIVIPSQNINLEIKESEIKNGVWGVNDSGASHLNTSANPGQNGAIVIYGHNRSSLFGNLNLVKRGEKISLLSTDGKTYIYEVVNSLVVTPKDTWVLQSFGTERLIVYTCTGFFDLDRLVLIAEPEHS